MTFLSMFGKWGIWKFNLWNSRVWEYPSDIDQIWNDINSCQEEEIRHLLNRKK